MQQCQREQEIVDVLGEPAYSLGGIAAILDDRGVAIDGSGVNVTHELFEYAVAHGLLVEMKENGVEVEDDPYVRRSDVERLFEGVGVTLEPASLIHALRWTNHKYELVETMKKSGGWSDVKSTVKALVAPPVQQSVQGY